MAADYNKYTNQINETLKTEEEERKKQDETKKAELQTQHDQDIASAEKNVGEQIKTTEQDYLDIVASNDLQRELDKRQIAETMANLGLTKSGLNATQQTAVQLSAGNKNYAALQQRQKAVNTLRQSLEDYKMQKENELSEANISIDAATQEALSTRKAELLKSANEAYAEEYKADQEAYAKIAEANAKAIQEQNSLYGDLMKNGTISLTDYERLLSGDTTLTEIEEETSGNDGNGGSANTWSWATTAYKKTGKDTDNDWLNLGGNWNIDNDDTVGYYNEEGVYIPDLTLKDLYDNLKKEIGEEDAKKFVIRFNSNDADGTNTTKFLKPNDASGWSFSFIDGLRDVVRTKYEATNTIYDILPYLEVALSKKSISRTEYYDILSKYCSDFSVVQSYRSERDKKIDSRNTLFDLTLGGREAKAYKELYGVSAVKTGSGEWVEVE